MCNPSRKCSRAHDEDLSKMEAFASSRCIDDRLAAPRGGFWRESVVDPAYAGAQNALSGA